MSPHHPSRNLAGPTSLDGKDPWFWSVDEVVACLCDPNSAIRREQQYAIWPDDTLLRERLREHQITGLALLKHVDVKFMIGSLNIETFGQRSSFQELIEALQDESLRYHDLKTRRLARAPSIEWPIIKTQHSDTASPRLSLLSLHSTAGIADPADTPPLSTDSDQPRPPVIISGSLPYTTSTQENVESFISNAGSCERVAENGIIEDHHSTIVNFRSHETAIVDTAGITRRRLAPTFISDITPDSKLSSSISDLAHINVEPGAYIDAIDIDAAPDNVVEPAITLSDTSPLPGGFATLISLDVESNHKSGNIHRDADGRKRVIPIQQRSLLSRPERSQDLNAIRSSQQIYLGSSPLYVDTIIYGSTKLGECLEQDDGLAQKEFQFYDDMTFSHAQKQCVSNVVHRVLCSKSHTVTYGGQTCLYIAPYPARLRPRNGAASMTLFKRGVDGEPLAFRLNRGALDGETIDSPSDSRRSGQSLLLDLLAFNDNASNDADRHFQSLEKWQFLDDDRLLPLYGDSDTDEYYDEETSKGLSSNLKRKLQACDIGRDRYLAKFAVQNTCDLIIQTLESKWNRHFGTKSLKCVMITKQRAQRQHGVVERIQYCEGRCQDLRARLTKVRAKIAEEKWARMKELTKQCQSMEETIKELENRKWELQVLQTSIPQLKTQFKDIQASTIPLRNLTKTNQDEEGTTRSIVIEEEDLESDDDLQDFIDDSETLDSANILSVNDEWPTSFLAHDHESANPTQLPNIKDQTEGSQISLRARTTHEPAGNSMSDSINFTSKSGDTESDQEHASSMKSAPSGVHTPPIDDFDVSPYDTDRVKAKPVFKQPMVIIPAKPSFVDLDCYDDLGKELPSTLLQAQQSRSKTVAIRGTSRRKTTSTVKANAAELPPLNDVQGIKRLDPRFLIEKQDRKRLLIWIVSHTPAENRGHAIDFIECEDKDEIQRAIITSLRSLLESGDTNGEKSPSDNKGAYQTAVWFVSWSLNVKYSNKGLSKSSLTEVLDNHAGLPDYLDFLSEILVHHDIMQHAVSLPHDEISTPKGKAKRQRILRNSREVLSDSPIRQRVFQVERSTESLEKISKAASDHQEYLRRRNRAIDKGRDQHEGEANHISQVLVNPGKNETHADIFLDQAFRGNLKPHQVEGLQFLWEKMTANHVDLQGCLLAQNMGLGKTIQVIALILTLSAAGRSEHDKIRTQVPPSLREAQVLILCPPSLVENWCDEINMWVPKYEAIIGRLFKIDPQSMDVQSRVATIDAWGSTGGILVMGYSMFRQILQNKRQKGRDDGAEGLAIGESPYDAIRDVLIGKTQLVIADEAHEFKNLKTRLSVMINRIKTKSRLALTGSPLANNLGEYFALIDWIAPKHLGTAIQFRAHYQEVIDEGLYVDSSDQQYRRARMKLKLLEHVMEPKVHRAGFSVLHRALHGKSEFIIHAQLTDIQHALYTKFIEAFLNVEGSCSSKNGTLWNCLHILQLLCNHPWLYAENVRHIGQELRNPTLRKKKRPVKTASNSPEGSPLQSGNDNDDEEIDITNASSRTALLRIIDAVEPLLSQMDISDDPNASCKMHALMTIIKRCEAVGDKLLVFSHRIPTLDYVQKCLFVAGIASERIDGKSDPQIRQAITKRFNKSKTFSVCLISTKAGGQGLNLFGANRIAILDCSYNPMYEQQAIGRAYRLGQQKPVYVYRLMVSGTFEQALHNQAIFKENLFFRVVDKRNPIRNAKKGARQYLFRPQAAETQNVDDLRGKDSHVLDHLIEQRATHNICSIIPSETFQIDDGVELTQEENQQVDRMQKDELLLRTDPSRYALVMAERDQRMVNMRRDLVATSSIPSVNMGDLNAVENEWQSNINQAAGNGVSPLTNLPQLNATMSGGLRQSQSASASHGSVAIAADASSTTMLQQSAIDPDHGSQLQDGNVLVDAVPNTDETTEILPDFPANSILPMMLLSQHESMIPSHGYSPDSAVTTDVSQIAHLSPRNFLLKRKSSPQHDGTAIMASAQRRPRSN